MRSTKEYMEFIHLFDFGGTRVVTDEALDCVLMMEPDNEVYHTVDHCRNRKSLMIVKSFRLEQLSSLKDRIHFVRALYAVSAFM